MRFASEKQVNYFMSLCSKWVAKMKRDYKYYNKENSTTVNLVNAFYRAIENGESGEIYMKDVSYVIKIMKDELNS